MLSNFQNDFMPHGFCIRWSWDLLTLYVVSDGLIFLAYTYIGMSLMLFAKTHKTLAWNPLLWLFSAFILACGITHLMGIVTFWQPFYWIDADLKGLTALISVGTVYYLAPRLAMLLQLHSHEELDDINRKLNLEIEERRKGHELLLKLSENIPGMLYQFQMLDEGRYEFPYISNGVKEIYGLSPQDIYDDSKKMFEFIHPDDGKNFCDSMEQSAQTMQMWNCEFRIILPEKGIRYLFGQSTPERCKDGNIMWHGYITDITTTKNIERTSHAQKMESIGRLTAGLAHDFNNLLMAISGYNELNKFSLEEVICENCDAEDIKAEITSNSSQINRACLKAADLIQKMMLYCRRDNDGNTHNPVLNLNDKILENLSMIRGMMPSTVIFETHLVKQTLALPELDETNFNQALINLYVNARDAMNEKGKIKLSTEIVNIESHCFCCKVDLKGSYIEVKVADTGAGMDSSIASRIFEPFYTTKEVGEGTGLGLSAVVGIVHKAGGHILLESEVDVGTTFRLLFPNELQ